MVDIKQCFVDMGYRGYKIKDIAVYLSGQKRGVTGSIKKALKRRSAIEPEFRFNNRKQNIYKMLLGVFRKEPLKLS